MNIDIQFEESNQSIDVDFGEIQIIGGSVVDATIEPLNVTENGTYTAHGDVDGYSPIRVNVPIPEGYIQPQGTIEITENGEYGVTEYANARVNVEEAKEEQEKTIDITENGTTEVTPDDGKVLSKVTVNVDVEKGITPTGTLEITENGEYDVTEYASANVSVESGGGSDLPDWDDDSPIILSGQGINEHSAWEITEKGTLKWRQTGLSTKAYAGFDSLSVSGIVNYSNDFAKNAYKVKQVILDGEFKSCSIVGLPNCERIKVSSNTPSLVIAYTGLKELDLTFFTKMREYQCTELFNLQDVVLNPSWVTLESYSFQRCVSLKHINLENITAFNRNSMEETMALEQVIFSANLLAINQSAFYRSGITSAIFQNASDNLPTIANNAFNQAGQLKDIYVPWSEGEVANAPWGATKATIHYNTTYDENHNPIV